jgi:hypothetical protein
MDNPYICVTCNSVCKLQFNRNSGRFLFKLCPKCGLRQYRKIDVPGKEMRGMVEGHKWYNVLQLSKEVDRTPSYVRYMVLRGSVPYYRIGGRIMFMDADVPAIKMFVEIQGRRGPKKKEV